MNQQQRQEFFDKGVNGIRAQGKRAVVVSSDGNEQCLYRTADGCKCAVGHNIPDELYIPAFEGRPAYRVVADRSEDVADYERRGMGHSPAATFGRCVVRLRKALNIENGGGEKLSDDTFIELFQKCHDSAKGSASFERYCNDKGLDPDTGAGGKLSKLPLEQQMICVEEAFEACARMFGLKYEFARWAGV